MVPECGHHDLGEECHLRYVVFSKNTMHSIEKYHRNCYTQDMRKMYEIMGFFCNQKVYSLKNNKSTHPQYEGGTSKQFVRLNFDSLL